MNSGESLTPIAARSIEFDDWSVGVPLLTSAPPHDGAHDWLNGAERSGVRRSFESP